MRSLALFLPLVLATAFGMSEPSALESAPAVPPPASAPLLESSPQTSEQVGLALADPGGFARPDSVPLLGELVPATSADRDLFASGTFQLAVPFHTQKDGERFQNANCGPASLAMVLDAFGMRQTNAELRWQSHTYQGAAGSRGGTALQFIAMAGRDFGLEPLELYEGQAFRRWNVADVRAELAAGRPVIPLVKYRLLPGHQSSTVRFDHYVVIYGADGGELLYHDPAYAQAFEGAARRMTGSQLEAAMRSASVPFQAVAFGPGEHGPLLSSAL